jgi:hypothetical protein
MRVVRKIRGLGIDGKVRYRSFKCIPKMFSEWILVKRALGLERKNLDGTYRLNV